MVCPLQICLSRGVSFGGQQVSDTSIEIRPINGHEGRYSARSDGRIVSHVKKPGELHLLGGGQHGKHVLVQLWRNGKSEPMWVHRLICRAFHGPAPTPDHCVNHKNGIPSDNRPENLEWCTHAENIRHAIDLGLQKRKLNSCDYEEVRNRHAKGETAASIARAMGMSSSHIARIVNGQRVFQRWRFSPGSAKGCTV